MRDKVASVDPARRRGEGWKTGAPFLLTVGAVVLGWQVALQPFVQRAPVDFAVRLAPGSPWVLSRAAESEMAAGRAENAASLARDALAAAPFDVRALRTVGLTEAAAGRTAVADDLLTLSGNWSLRDSPSHAWLVDYRLRRGDYASSFAHADTLARRRPDNQTEIFSLFTVAATHDRDRVLPVLARLLAIDPPWRAAYLSSLNANDAGFQVAAALAVLLQESDSPMTDKELSELYVSALNRGHIGAVATVRDRLRRPASSRDVTDGGFTGAAVPEPFGWKLEQSGGALAEMATLGTAGGDTALRVEYDGHKEAIIARQLLLLPPGRYTLEYRVRTEAGNPDQRLRWSLQCRTGAAELLGPTSQRPETGGWRAVRAEFVISAACPAQWLRLEGLPSERRTETSAWFDSVRISSAG